MDIINKKKDDIPKVLIGLNLIFLVISFFHTSFAYEITIIIMNLIFLSTILILDKFAPLFVVLSTQNKMAKKLNEVLHKV